MINTTKFGFKTLGNRNFQTILLITEIKLLRHESTCVVRELVLEGLYKSSD